MSGISQYWLGSLLAVHLAIPPSIIIAPSRFLPAPVARQGNSIAQGSEAGKSAQIRHRTENVRIVSEPGVVLAGELRIPATLSKGGYPVVLLLGGGGPSPHGIYPVLEERLLANGIATLSYDKRGIGKSTGKFVDTMDLMQPDAGAAIDYLRSRKEIDPKRVAVLGLSQGGVIGPTLASHDLGIRAVVMLAAPAGQRGVMFLDEMRIKLTASGMQKIAVEKVITATRAYMEVMTTAAPVTTITAARDALNGAFVAAGWDQAQANGALHTLSDPATVSLYTVAANDVLKRVKAPVLALYAADDTVISTPRSVPEARFALRNNSDAIVIKVPDVNHGFQRLISRVSGKPKFEGWPVSDPKTLDLVNQWLAKRLLPGADD